MDTMKCQIRALIKYKHLIRLLIAKDIKLKYRRSFLGYIWSILNPLLIMTVMTVVFSTMFKRNIENFPVYLLSGNILYTFMRESSTRAMSSLTGNAALLKKTYVPKYIFTVSTITSDLINLLFSMCALLVVMIVTGVKFTLYTLLFFIPILELYVFCIGLGLFLAQASVFFTDIQYIWAPITLSWLYLSPIIYPMDALPELLQWLISRFNPLYYYITVFRDFVMYGVMPWWPNIWRGGLIAILMLAIGIGSFIQSKDKFILHI